MWMGSPGHRANLLDRAGARSAFRQCSHHSPGAYGGDEVTIVTADFGVRNPRRYARNGARSSVEERRPSKPWSEVRILPGACQRSPACRRRGERPLWGSSSRLGTISVGAGPPSSVAVNSSGGTADVDVVGMSRWSSASSCPGGTVAREHVVGPRLLGGSRPSAGVDELPRRRASVSSTGSSTRRLDDPTVRWTTFTPLRAQ